MLSDQASEPGPSEVDALQFTRVASALTCAAQNLPYVAQKGGRGGARQGLTKTKQHLVGGDSAWSSTVPESGFQFCKVPKLPKVMRYLQAAPNLLHTIAQGALLQSLEWQGGALSWASLR